MTVKFNSIFALFFFVALASSAENSIKNCPFNQIRCSCMDQGSRSESVGTSNFPGVDLTQGAGAVPVLSYSGHSSNSEGGSAGISFSELCMKLKGISDANVGSGSNLATGTNFVSGIGYSGENLKYAGGLVGGSFSTNIGNTIYVHPSAIAGFIGSSSGGYSNTGNNNQGVANIEKIKTLYMLQAKLKQLNQQSQIITSLIKNCYVDSRPAIELKDLFKPQPAESTSKPSSESEPKTETPKVTPEPAKPPADTTKECNCLKCTATFCKTPSAIVQPSSTDLLNCLHL